MGYVVTESHGYETWFRQMRLEIGKWADYNFPDDDSVMMASAVSEEANELLRAIRKQKQGIRGTWEEWEAEARREAADTLIALFQVAGRLDWDLLEDFQKRWAEVRARDFRADQVGHGMPKEDEA